MKNKVVKHSKMYKAFYAVTSYFLVAVILVSAGAIGITHGLDTYSDWDSLKSAIEAQTDLTAEYVLGADLTATSSISVPVGKTVTLSGNYSIETGAAFADDSVIKVTSGAFLNVSNVTFSAFPESGNVRAIYNGGGKVNLTSVTIDGFSGTVAGAAVASESGDVSINGCTITNCSADIYGGAIYFTSSSTKYNLSITNGTVIDSCLATGDPDSCGGAVYSNSSNVIFDNSTISNCTAERYGGGIYCSSYSVFEMTNGTITNCKVVCSDGTGGGGGLCINSSSGTINSGTISYCASNNTNSIQGGGGGGGILVTKYTYGSTYASLKINDCNINNCTSSFTGGGISVGELGSCEINRATIYDCSAKICGGGIYVEQGDREGVDSSRTAILKLNPVAVYDNYSVVNGGGIYSCPAASKNVIGAYSASVFNNTADTQGDDYFAHVRKEGNSGASTISMVPLGGSTVGVYVDEKGNRYSDGFILPATADYYTNTNKLLAIHTEYTSDEINYSKNKAQVLIYNNKVTDPSSNYGGGGIGCNGTLIIKSEPDITKVEITKVWEDADGNVTNIHPDNIDVQLWRVSLSTADQKQPEKVGSVVTLSDENDWHYLWPDLDENYSYYVSEANDLEGWKPTYNIIRDQDDDKKLLITVTNTCNFCNLKISKKVVNDTAFTPTEKEFVFTVSSSAMTSTYSYSVYNSATDEKIDTFPIENNGTINLKDGQYAVIENIPEGMYSVTETGDQNYIANVKVTGANEYSYDSENDKRDLDIGHSGVTNVHTMLTFDFSNEYAPSAKAQLSVNKITDGSTITKDFEFGLFECNENGEWDEEAEPILTASTDTSELTEKQVDFDKITYSTYNTVEYYAIKELTKDGEGWDCDNETTIYAKVVISEPDTVTGETATTVSYGYSLSNGVLDEELDEVQSITNTYGRGSLRLTKEGEGYDSSKTFRITLSGESLSSEYTEGKNYSFVIENKETNKKTNITRTFTNGAFTFVLSVNETILISDLLIGEYTLSELAYTDNTGSATVEVGGTQTVSVSEGRDTIVTVNAGVEKDTQTDVTFVNKYTPEPDSIKMALQIEKDGSGNELDKVFTFGMYECTDDGEFDADNPTFTKDTKVTEETTQILDFTEIEYKKAGTFYYAIKEITQDGDGWTCDNETTMYAKIVVTETPAAEVGGKSVLSIEKNYGTALIDGELSSPTEEVQKIVNNKGGTVSFEFVKTNADLTVNLEGAEFALYECENTDAGHVHVTDTASADFCYTSLFATDKSKIDGKVSFAELKAGTQYLLVETKAPEGYALPKGGWLVTVDKSERATITVASRENQPPSFTEEQTDEGVYIYKCTNVTQKNMPLAGGTGTITIMSIGILSMLLAVAVFIILLKKEVQRNKNIG